MLDVDDTPPPTCYISYGANVLAQAKFYPACVETCCYRRQPA